MLRRMLTEINIHIFKVFFSLFHLRLVLFRIEIKTFSDMHSYKQLYKQKNISLKFTRWTEMAHLFSSHKIKKQIGTNLSS